MWIADHAATTRLAAAAMCAWIAAVLPLSAAVVTVVSLGVTGACTWALLRGRRTARGRKAAATQTIVRTLLSAALFASLAAAGVGAVGTRTQAAAGPIDVEVLVISDPQTGPSGMQRAQASSTHGNLTVLSRTDIPLAGAHARLRGEARREGPSLVVFARSMTQTSAPGPAWRVRASLRDYLRQACGTASPGATLLPGLVLGDVSGVSGELDADMKTVSLSHITAVSGANISLVSLAVLWLCRLVTVRSLPGISAAFLVTAGYVFLVGPDASVIRAAGMGLVGAVVLLRGAGRSGFAVLCCAIAVLLVLKPELAASAGFALSAAATTALIILGEPLVRLLERAHIPRIIAAACAVPICAQAGVLPILVAMGSAPSAWAVVLNVLAAPAVAPATVLGLACVCCGFGSLIGWLPGHEVLAQLCVRPAVWCAEWIARLATVGSRLPGAVLPWPPGVAGILAAAALTACIALFVLGTRRWRAGAAAGVLVCLLAGLGLPRLTAGGSLPENWRVLVCDVGQGSAALVRLDAGRVLIVDAGPDPARLDACLRTAGARDVFVMISHLDADHAAGAVGAVRGGRRVEGLWLGQSAARDPRSASLRSALAVAPHEVAAGARLGLGEVTWGVEWPSPAGGGGATGGGAGASGQRNEQALVVRVEAGDLSVLLPADLGEVEQRRLAATIAPADVLLAPHHGSADLSPDFFAAVQAKAGIVSVGENSYGHPTQTALRAFGPVPVLRTDECGSVWITDAGEISGQRGCAARIDP